MKISQYDGERIQIVQRKTGAVVWVRAHRDLKPILDEERRTAIGDATILRAPDGGGFKERAFAERWDAVMESSGLAVTELRRQDLRRTAVIRLFEAGCNTGQIASITGHTLQQVENILETYFVRTKTMGDAAILKLEEHQDRLAEERETREAGNGFPDGSTDSGNGFSTAAENPNKSAG
jgi:integrase